MEFKVLVENGNVFIDGKFVEQLCFDGDSVGSVVANYINGYYDEDDSTENDGWEEEFVDGKSLRTKINGF